MSEKFYDWINVVLDKIKHQEQIDERQHLIHTLTVSRGEFYKKKTEMMIKEGEIRKKIGNINGQIKHIEDEIEILREKQYYLIEWRDKCCRLQWRVEKNESSEKNTNTKKIEWTNEWSMHEKINISKTWNECQIYYSNLLFKSIRWKWSNAYQTHEVPWRKCKNKSNDENTASKKMQNKSNN